MKQEDPVAENDVNNKFRSMKEIREELEDLYLNEETDFEIMQKYVSYLIADESDESKISALKELEFYVHQIDNAKDFFTIDHAFDTLLLCCNDSNSDIRLNAVHVIGSAVQSNPAAQVEALKGNILPNLLRLLSNPLETVGVKKKVIYTLSSLLRNFPRAQIELWQLAGYHSLLDVLINKENTMLQIKVVRLFADLIFERQNIDKTHIDYKEKARQYSIVPLNTIIHTLGFCNEILFLLKDTALPDEVETVLNTLTIMRKICPKDLSKDDLKSKLSILEKQYIERKVEEEQSGDDDGYFKLMYNLIKTVQKQYTLLDINIVDNNKSDANGPDPVYYEHWKSEL